MKKELLIFVITFILSLELNAQIIYTDVIPDLTFTADQQYLLDVDNDTNPDYIIEQVDSVIAGNPLEGVQLRSVGTVNEAVYETSTLTFLKGFALGNLIDQTELWTVPNPSLPAGGEIIFNGNPTPAGDWSDGLDHYAALRFTTGLNQYYGWVRFTVTPNGLSFIIKDYAYHSVPEQALLAGSTVDGVEELESNFSISKSGNVFIINNSTNGNNFVELIDINGKLISTNQFQWCTQIDLTLVESGLYFLNCSNGKEFKSFKVYR